MGILLQTSQYLLLCFVFLKLAYAAPCLHGNGTGNLSSIYGVPP